MKKKLLSVLSIVLCVLLCSCGNAVFTDGMSDIADGVVSEEVSSSNPTVTTDTADAPDTADSPESDQKTPVAEPDRLSLIMVGDILMHDPVLESGRTSEGYSYHHIFENVADEIKAADVAIFNQEVMIAGERYGVQGYPKFNAPFELADAIAAAGFDVAAHATNHTLDVGKDAMLECLANWENKYPEIEIIGMHESSEDAEHISVIEKNGIKMAVLNYTDIMNLVGVELCREEPYLVDMFEESRIRRDVQKAREIADFVTVCAHWGSEYTHSPSDTQKKWADIMLECGVDLVLGTHPHVIQPVEWLEHENGNKMLVYWSLGNFVNSTGESGRGKGARMLGAMADVTLARNNDGKVYIADASAVPLVTHIRYESFGITTYLFSEYTEEMLKQSEAVNIDYTFSYSYCEKTFSDILGGFIKKQP